MQTNLIILKGTKANDVVYFRENEKIIAFKILYYQYYSGHPCIFGVRADSGKEIKVDYFYLFPPTFYYTIEDCINNINPIETISIVWDHFFDLIEEEYQLDKENLQITQYVFDKQRHCALPIKFDLRTNFVVTYFDRKTIEAYFNINYTSKYKRCKLYKTELECKQEHPYQVFTF